MRAKMFGCLMLWMAGTCFGQEAMPLCPRHIETPLYPPIAHTANVYGKVFLTITINADGKVVYAEISSVANSLPLLERDTISNIRRWTFTKPPVAPYKQAIEYDYEIDSSLPVNTAAARVTFDLPDRITIVIGRTVLETDGSTNKD
jgi:TonB family protein